MAQIKLSKTELREQQTRLDQLQTYLPTLQLKKALLQAEISQAIIELESKQDVASKQELALDAVTLLFSEREVGSFVSASGIEEVHISYENIAGVEIPCLDKVVCKQPQYYLFDTPMWYESLQERMQSFLQAREAVKVAMQKKVALEKELREVSIRVNLFEKIMIPRALEQIKKIKIFLGDQQLASVSQAKIAKKKIVARERIV